MILGGVTMTWLEPKGYWNPDEFTPSDDEKVSAVVMTETTAVYFRFRFRLIGKEIELSWKWMSSALFAALDALFVAGLPVTWNPEEPGMATYTVEIMALEGKTFDTIGYQQPYREEVKLRLAIVEGMAVL